MKSIFMSDLHLGNPHCQADKLYNFLKSLELPDGSYRVENLFLVGDIIDITGFNNKIFWSNHRKVIKKFLRMADRGVKIYYIIGNHDYHLEDEILNNYEDVQSFNNIIFCREFIYKNILLIHGDQFDGVVKVYPFLYTIGDFGYHLLIHINHLQNKIRRFLGMQEWSFSLWVKTKVKKAIQFINHFEDVVCRYAKERNANTVISGHIHKAEDTIINDIRYINTGCWVEFCSYVVEHQDNTLELKYYE